MDEATPMDQLKAEISRLMMLLDSIDEQLAQVCRPSSSHANDAAFPGYTDAEMECAS